MVYKTIIEKAAKKAAVEVCVTIGTSDKYASLKARRREGIGKTSISENCGRHIVTYRTKIFKTWKKPII